MKQELPEDHGGHTIQWQHFLELWILTSPNLRLLAEKVDCNQVIRNFVEAFLEIKEDDYFRDEFVSRLYRCLEGDKEQMGVIEDIIWSWLDENGFIEHEAIQRELLWTFPERSKTFYLLLVSIAVGTFKTTPLDMAYELLI